MLTKNQFGVLYVLTIFTCLWGLYLFNFKSKDPNSKYLLGECVTDYSIPMPLINRYWELDYEKCLDGWSINHLCIYLVTGMLFPNEYLMVFLLSLICEIMEILGRSRGRLSDIIVNLVGYLIGSLLSTIIIINFDIDGNYKSFILPCFILSILVFIKIAKRRRNELDKIKLPSWKE